MKITYLERINHTKYGLKTKSKYGLKTKSLDEIICTIRNGNLILHDNEYGDYTLKHIIDFFRSTHPVNLQDMKYRLLPAVAYNGTFRELNGAGLIEYSCVTALDFDIATPDEMIHLRNRLIRTPCVLSVFVTPSGNGLKALVLHDNTDPAGHGDLYEQLLNKFYVADRNDAGCKDLARRNYLSYDPYI